MEDGGKGDDTNRLKGWKGKWGGQQKFSRHDYIISQKRSYKAFPYMEQSCGFYPGLYLEPAIPHERGSLIETVFRSKLHYFLLRRAQVRRTL